MADLFDKGDDYDKVANTPNKIGQLPNVRKLPQVLSSSGYDPSAGQSTIQDMPIRSTFDKGLMEGQNIDDYRADQQSSLDLAGVFLGRTLGQGIAKVGEGFSMLGGAILGGATAGLEEVTTGKTDINFNDVINNPVTKMFTSFEDAVKEKLPVYHDSNYDKKTESEKFFGNFGQYMADSGSEMTSFMLGLLVPSGAVSDLGVGVSLLGDATRGATALSKTLTAMGASEKLLQTAAKGVDLATQYAVHGSIESMFMAKSTGDQFMQQYLAQVNSKLPQGQQPYKSINDLPDNLKKDAGDKAAGAMKNDYYWNLMAGAPAALFEMGLINKFIGKGAKSVVGAVSNDIDAGEAITDEAKLATKTPYQGLGSGKFKTLTAAIANTASSVVDTRVGAVLKSLPKSVLIEGAYKMNLQHQLQEMSTQYGLEGKSGYFLESGLKAGEEIINSISPEHWNDPKYQSSRDAMFSGSILGAIMGGVTEGTVGYKNHQELKAQKADATSKAISYLNQATSDFISQDQYVTQNVPQGDGSNFKQIQFDENNQPIQDKAAMVNFLGNQQRMSDLVATEQFYANTGDKQMANIIRDERTTDWALAHLQAGKGDAMFSKLDKLATAHPEDLQKLGFDPTYYDESGHAVPIHERAEQIRDKVAKVKQYYDEATSNIPNEQTGRIEELTRLKSRIDSIKDQSDDLTNQRDSAAMDYKDDHVKQIDEETRRLRALEDNKDYIEERSKDLESRKSEFEDNVKDLEGGDTDESIKRIREGHEFDTNRINLLRDLHSSDITASKAKIDSLKTTYKSQLDAAGHDSTIGKYNLLSRAGKGQGADIKDADTKIIQLNSAVQEHQHEYDELAKPISGQRHYENRLQSSFHQATVDAGINANQEAKSEIPKSEFEPQEQPIVPGVNEKGEIVPTQQPDKTPEVLHTDPSTLTQSMELPQSSDNQADVIKGMTTTEGRLDQSKLDKFTQDNLGKRLKVTYDNDGKDVSIFGIIKDNAEGTPVFVQDNGKEIPIQRLLGGKIKSIVPIFSQTVTVPKTEQAPTPKQSKIVTEPKQREFTDTMYNPSKPYLSVGLSSTTGVDGADETQERWFRTTENLNLNDGKYQLVTVTKANEANARKLLGSDWNDKLLYDENTIKTVLLKDGKPVKTDQFGKESKTGEIAFSTVPLTPEKSQIGIVEHKSFVDKREAEKLQPATKDYTHQGDKKAKFIATEQEVKDGTIDKILQQHKNWRSDVLADPNTKVIDITSKGSGIRVRGDLGPVQGRLTEDQVVDVKIAKGESISDPSGKSITVKPGLSYAEYKDMVVPLTGRTLRPQEQAVIKEVLKRWSQAASEHTKNDLRIKLSNAIEARDKDNIADLKNKLGNIDKSLPFDKSLPPEELDDLYTRQLGLTTDRNSYKTYLEDMIRFGDTDKNGIYIDKGQIIFGDKAIAQEDLWSGKDTPELDKFLNDKYLQNSSRAGATSKPFTEYTNTNLDEREWKSYNHYLTSNEYPDETTRKSEDIPFRTHLAPMGEAQFNSVNLRFSGVTDATQPIRTDTQAYKKIAEGTQESDKTFKQKALSYDKVLGEVNNYSEGSTFRVGLRLTDRTKGQEPFYIDYKVQDGEAKFIQLTKRDGTTTDVEPKSFEIVRQELNDQDSSLRPTDLHYEYLSVKDAPIHIEEEAVREIKDITPPTESVEEQPFEDYHDSFDNPNEIGSADYHNDVINELNKIGDFVGTGQELADFIQQVLEVAPDTTPANMAKSYVAFNEGAIKPKNFVEAPNNTKRRTFRGMTADGSIQQPINFNEAKDYIDKRFTGIDVKQVNGLIQGKYWGLFDSAGQVLLSTDAVKGTAYHEAFHVASLLYHTPEERKGVYDEYRQRTGSTLPDVLVEEKLAEQFQQFVESEGTYKFPDKQQSFFQKLWTALKSFLGFKNSNNIESTFDKINNGGYANEEVSDQLGLQSSAPMDADHAETFTRTHALIDDMTVSFFDHFFSNGNNIETLFNVFAEGKQSILVDDIYKQMLEEYQERAKDGGLVSTFNNEGKWNEMVKLHKQELANLGLKLIDKTATDYTSAEDNRDFNPEIDGQKDNAQMESHIEMSSKEGMPKIVKFFLSSLPELDYAKDKDGNYIEEDGKRVLERVPSAYFTDKVANPEKIMNILGNKLAGMTDIADMVSTIKDLSEDYPTLNGLLSRMQLGDEILPKTATANEARFQTLFWQQFAKANNDYYLTYLREDGSVSVLNSNSETQQAVTRELWRTNLISQLNSPTGIIKIEDNKLVISKDKVQQLKAITDPFERAEKLGIQFTFPDKIRKDPTLFKQFRENLDAIVNTIIASKQPVTDLYSREGLNAQNRIRNIADLEAKTNPDSIERQHMGLDNKTQYSLTLNHSLSLAIGELNNRLGSWYDAIKQSAYSQNSVIAERLKDPEYKIGLAVNDGITRQGADGEETAKLTPADALANMINGVVNGYYSILRPGDKKLEYKLKFGEFIPSKGLIGRDGDYSAKVNKTFRGYLQDEFNRVFALKAGYDNNIKEFNKHALLKNGRLDLGLFNDILSDVKMPVINSAEDAAKWIDENKEVVDANVKKFLESTTNQYGANARKLSVFKETMNKTGRRTYVPTGDYMLNGIDNQTVNTILGKDPDNKIYSKNDIHQFFRYVTVNQLMGNIEQTKLTTGAIEFYKDPLKRFSALTGTKKLTRVDSDYQNWENQNMPKEGYINGQKIKLTQDTNVRIVTTKDIISTLPKEQLDNFREGLKASGMAKADIDKYMDKFQNINEADAQSWIHLPAYRQFLSRTGDWTSAHEGAYQKAIRGRALSAEDLFLFPPLKPQAFGPQEAAGVYTPLFVKTSISPLIPFVIKGTDLEQMMHKMYKSDIDMLSTESAIKVGGKIDVNTGDFTDLYTNTNNVGTIDPTPFDKSLVSTLPAQYMGIQLDVAPVRKTYTTRGTQHEKMIMSNIKNIEGGEEIVKTYKDTISKLVDIAKNEMQDKMGIKSSGDNYVIPDKTKLLNYLEDQSIQRGVPTNTLIGLREALTNGSTLDAVVNKDRLDSVLASIITNGAIKNKRNGEQRVQVAVTGYGSRTYEGNKLQTSDKLKPYTYDPKGTKPMEIMTALPKALVPYVEKVGGLAKFNEMIANGEVDERILRGVGFRIPTQQLSSMVHYTVKEFLPYESGPVVVLPSVITTIAGSDFDIDKLSMYEKNYDIKYGNVGLDFRPQLRKQLTDAGLIDQFKSTYNSLPEAMTDLQVSNLLNHIDNAPESITDDELDKMEAIISKLQKKYTSDPSLSYIESDGTSKQALENKLLEINEQVLSHPSNFKNLIAPIGNEVLSGLADDMVKLRDKAVIGKFNDFEVQEQNPYKSAELMNMNYLLDQGQRFQAGKDLLGIAAKQNTHHVLSQLSELSLKPEVKVWFKGMEDSLRLDNITDIDGKHQVSDVISEFINGFVDIVKDQFTYDLNANQHTINPFFYLTRVGVPIESTTSFLNQPVIRKYINDRNINDSLISKGLPDAYKKSNYQTIESLRKELVEIAKGDNNLYYKWKPFDGKMPHYMDSEERDKIRATYKDITKSELDKMILDPNSPQAAVGQLHVLDQFLEYQDKGNQLTNLMMLNSQDTDGVKKSLTRSYVERAMYNEFMKDGSTMFSNPETVVNNSLIKPYFNIVMEGEKYFSSLFDSKSDKSNLMRHEFAHQITSMGVDKATDSMKKFENHLVAHLLQNITTENFPVSLSDEAVKNTVHTKEDGTVSLQPSLLLGNDSAVNSLIKFRKNLDFPNDFINSLFGIKGIDRTQGNYLDTVRMFTKRINKQQADILSGSATDLLNSNPELAKRLFRTTVAQSGLNNSYMSYHNTLPAKWFHNFVREVLDVYRTQDVPTQNIIDDYYRNNWKNNILVPTVENRVLSKQGDYAYMDINNRQYSNNLYIKQYAPPEGMSRQEFFKQRSDDTIPAEEKPKWEVYLYKHYDNEDNRIVYKRVNPLGASEKYQETGFDWKSRSVLNSNNKVDGEFVSSENYNHFTGYKPDVGKNDPSSVVVPDTLKTRLAEAGKDLPQEKVDEATKLYQQKIAEGMSEEQAADRAEKEITCK